MRTLYLRNVPDEVAERLEELARRERLSLNAYAVRALEALARSSGGNEAVLAALPHRDAPDAATVLAAIREGRR